MSYSIHQFRSDRFPENKLEMVKFVDGSDAFIVPSLPESILRKSFQGGWNGYTFYIWDGCMVAIPTRHRN